jgi:cobalamin transport system substrate-binding protein
MRKGKYRNLKASKIILIAAILSPFFASYAGQRLMVASEANHEQSFSVTPRRPATNCKRIISLAPSITEILFQLGLGPNVVGVTRYCDYPPEARDKPRIGGYYNPSYEAIYSHNPDLVILLTEHENPEKYLTKLGLNILKSDHNTIEGILQSIDAIGTLCNVAQKARAITSAIKDRIEIIRRSTSALNRPRVVISIGRNMGSGTLKDIYAAGKGGFYDQMIELAGGVNAYHGVKIKFPVLSTEGIIRLDPEVIIDMIPDMAENNWDEKTILKQWANMAEVDAVKNGRVHVFDDDYVVTPGPRFILLLEKLARSIHPEVKWK